MEDDPEIAASLAIRLENGINSMAFIPTNTPMEALEYATATEHPELVIVGNVSGIERSSFIKGLDRILPHQSLIAIATDDDATQSPGTIHDGIETVSIEALHKRIHSLLDIDRREEDSWWDNPCFQSSPDPMLVIDDDGICISANDAANECFQKFNTPIIGNPIGTYTETALNFDSNWRHFATRGRDRGTLPIRSNDGSEARYDYSAAIDVTPGRHLLVLRDVTSRVRSEQALEILQDATSRLVEASEPNEVVEIAIGVAERDLGFELIGIWLLNDERNRLLPAGLSTIAIESLGEDIPTIGSEDDVTWGNLLEHDLRIVDQSHGTGLFGQIDQVNSEMVLTLGDHGVLLIGSNSDDLFDWTTVRLGQLLAAHTTTALDSVSRQAELLTQTAKLERQNTRLDTLASVLSHDLRNPLTVAKGHLELEGTSQGKHLSAVSRALDRMEEIIDDVLAMARAGNTALNKQPVDLERVVGSAWQTSRTKSAELVIHPGLTSVTADEGRLKSLLENLFRNAVEHGHNSITVEVGPLNSNGFFVADDGPGIPKKERDKVFEFGYSTNDDGTGIGLAVVESIASAHGWRIGVNESDRGGTRFEIHTD